MGGKLDPWLLPIIVIGWMAISLGLTWIYEEVITCT